jgi:orotidine-5'-phosphate decarboxylase
VVEPGSRVIVALDYAALAEALAMLERLDPALCRVKIGKELFTRCGPGIVGAACERGFDVFLDLKFHDIPNTVAGACRAAAELGCWMINVHASGGRAMLEAARAAVDASPKPPLLIAVTVLTSLDRAALAECGNDIEPAELALKLAQLAQDSGLDGVVCAATEAKAMRDRFGSGFLLVTPGIRPSGAAADDQRRIATPGAAIAAGADYLVIGRPVTQAADPNQVLCAIRDEVSGARAS